MGLIRRAKHSVGHRTDYPNRARALRLLRKPSQKPVTDAAIVQAPEVWRKWLRPSLPPRPEAGAFASALIMAGRWLLTISDKEQGAGNIIRQVHRILRCLITCASARDFSRSRTTSSARLSVRSPR